MATIGFRELFDPARDKSQQPCPLITLAEEPAPPKQEQEHYGPEQSDRETYRCLLSVHDATNKKRKQQEHDEYCLWDVVFHVIDSNRYGK